MNAPTTTLPAVNTAAALLSLASVLAEDNRMDELRDVEDHETLCEYVASVVEDAANILQITLPPMNDELGAIHATLFDWAKNEANNGEGLDDVCDECNGPNPDGGDGFDGKCASCADEAEDEDEYPPKCSNPDGHAFAINEETDRCLCAYCGADGDA